MIPRRSFSKDLLTLHEAEESERIISSIRSVVPGVLHKKGAVVAVSGGIDSAVCVALCVGALGKDRVVALLLPERHSSEESLRLGRIVAETFGVSAITREISPVLQALGCYRAQEEAVRTLFPEFGAGWKFKVTLPSAAMSERLSISRLTVRAPSGGEISKRMPSGVYLQLVAATNFKQRTRTMVAYYEADRLNYAVCGTPNRLEYDQGFFVKGGDGLADFKPIAHLYKSQVYCLARYLDVPEEIRARTPTTDTFPLEQTQEEFYFGVPSQVLDYCLYGLNNGYEPSDVAAAAGFSVNQVKRIYDDILLKRRTTRPLHLSGILASQVPEVGPSASTGPPHGEE